MAIGAPFCGGEQTFHRSQRYRLMLGHHAALRVAGGEKLTSVAHQAHDHADAHEGLRVLLELFGQQVERAHRGHDKATR